MAPRRVLCLSSQVVYGPVGNSAAVPALQAMGHEVLPLPTILLSHHPGHGRPAVQRISDETFGAMLSSLEHLGALSAVAAVMTGYFGGVGQVNAAARVISQLRAGNPALHVLVDPVMGDEEGLYVAADIAAAIRDELMPLATITTPNRFELAWLTGLDVTEAATAEAASGRLGTAEVLATSLPAGGMISTRLHYHGRTVDYPLPRRKGVPHGTGDFLAGLYLASRVAGQHPETAASRAMAALSAAIDASLGATALDLASGLRVMSSLS
jgi:pyridoxine kinase